MARLTTKTDERPSWQFYPKDWLTDRDLRLCSFAAQGLWMRMLCAMWLEPVRGTLPGDIASLSAILGVPVDELVPLIGELEAKSVLERLSDGRVANRRMYREWHISQVRARAGKSGAESRWSDDSSNGKPHGKTMANVWQNDGKSLSKPHGKNMEDKTEQNNELEKNADSKAMANVMAPRARAHSSSFSFPSSSLRSEENVNVQPPPSEVQDATSVASTPTATGAENAKRERREISHPTPEDRIAEYEAAHGPLDADTRRSMLNSLRIRYGAQQAGAVGNVAVVVNVPGVDPDRGHPETPGKTESWTPPSRQKRRDLVELCMSVTGDRRSEPNWWRLVNAMTATKEGLDTLLSVVQDFEHELQRKDPLSTKPDRPGAVLNATLRAECKRLGIVA